MRRMGYLVTLAGVLSITAALTLPVVADPATPTLAGDACDTSLPPPTALQNLSPDQEAEVDALLEAMPLEVKIGQMLMAGITGTVADDDARAMIDGLHIGNVILMGRNIENPAQVQALTNELQDVAAESNGVGAIIATDHGVMPAHVVYPALDPDGNPATISHAIQTDLLRDELSFDGMIITDDMGIWGTGRTTTNH